ncbi:hypothetical protein D172_005895 [Pseudoalteromonas sp. Bsw20308]|nr:hypothetical protein D172_005895 [Pseudoalteromonas sp. Bsw20308]
MKKIYDNLLLVAIILPILLCITLPILMDFTDPPFISNELYNVVFFITLPIICCALFIYLNILIFNKYKRCSKYRESLKYNFSDTKIKLAFIFMYPLSPLLIYGILYVFISDPIKLWAYYTQGDYWYKEYILTDVQECGTEYENSCTRLYFKDPKTNKIHDFRWYDDKSTIMNNKNDYVYIVGEASLFGYIVRDLER